MCLECLIYICLDCLILPPEDAPGASKIDDALAVPRGARTALTALYVTVLYMTVLYVTVLYMTVLYVTV